MKTHQLKKNERLRSFACLMIALAFLYAGLCASACGYRFGVSAALPEGVETVAVTLFENRTGENGLPQMLFNHLAYELTRRGMSLVPMDGADVVVRGVIRSVRTETIRRETTVSRERRLTVIADAHLVGRNGDVIRTAAGVSADRTYAVSQTRPATERSRREALDRLSRRLAENMHEALMDRF